MKQTVTFCICLITSIGLFVGGFFVPPLGIIDGSILSSVGLLLAFATLAQVPAILESAGHIKMRSGSVTIDVMGDKDNEKEENNEDTN